MCGKRLQIARPSPSAREIANRATHEPGQGRRAKGFGPAWLGNRFPYFPDPSPRFVPFRAEPIVLGRNPDCDVPLDGRAVSWEHAEIAVSGRTAVIRDLQSTNGVMVDGARVHEADLDEGALVRLGDFIGVVAPTPSTEDRASLAVDAAAVGMHLGPDPAGGHRAAGRRPGRVPAHRDRGRDRHRQDADRAGSSTRRSAADGPFLALDCGAVDPYETSRLLFGDASTRGALEQSIGGTVYLGSIAALDAAAGPPGRSIAEGAGADRAGRSGARSPWPPPWPMAAWRAPLYQQLDGVKMRLPPLRRRVVEIPALFRHLYRRDGRGRCPPLSTEMVERLCLYDWPCNVREMVLLLLRLISLHGDEERLRVGPPAPPHVAARPGQGPPLRSCPRLRVDAPSCSTRFEKPAGT